MESGSRVTLYRWQLDRLAELTRDWRPSYLDYEMTVIEGVPAMRVTLSIPDPKQEDHAVIRLLVTAHATVQLPREATDGEP